MSRTAKRTNGNRKQKRKIGNERLVNRIAIGLTIDKEVNEQLRELSENTAIPMSRLADRAFVILLKEYQAAGVSAVSGGSRKVM